jgi:hypothetical protein
MHAERLLKLADLLEADAARPDGIKFDLGTWGRWRNGEAPSLSCGTTACAMGLAALSGSFAEDGLTYAIEWLPDRTIGGYGGISVKFDDQYNLDAAAQLFGITGEAADFLFVPDAYDVTPVGAEGECVVAQRIRDFVAGRVQP